MATKKLNSFGEQVKGRWREFVREPSAFFFVMFMPIIWMAILGMAFSHGHKESYGIGWETGAALMQPVAQRAQEALRHDSRIRLTVGDAATLQSALQRGDVQVIVRFVGPHAQYLFDPADREAARARWIADDVVQQSAGRTRPVLTEDHKIEVPGTRYIDFLVPGLVALSIMTSSLYGTGMVVVSNRRENLLKRYLATPMRPFSYIASHIVGRGFILAVELTAILVAGLAMFHFHVAGNLLSFIVFAALGAAAFTALAMLCGARTSNVAFMNGMTNLIALPMMIVAGVWFARSNFPGWISEAARYLPLTALVDGLRRIALEGASITSLGFEMAVLAVYLVVAAVLTRVLFKWY